MFINFQLNKTFEVVLKILKFREGLPQSHTARFDLMYHTLGNVRN